MTKKKGGRPKQPPTAQVGILMSLELKTQLEQTAAAQGLTVSEYVRLKVFGDTSTQPARETFADGIPLPRNRAEFEKLMSQAGMDFHNLVQTYTDHMKRVEDVARRKVRGEAISPMDELFYGSGEARDLETGEVIARRKPEEE
jgi:hypothetical protein